MQYIVEGTTRYQNGNLAAMMYENSLLQQRNRVLADENSKLISVIQDLQQLLTKNNENIKKYENKMTYFQENNQNISQQIRKMIKMLHNKIGEKQQSRFKLLHQMMKNGCHQSSILQKLCQLIQNFQVKSNSKISQINRLSQLVEKRKQKLNVRQNKNKQILHLIKEPAYIQTGIIQADLQFIVRQSQKIAHRIKRKQVKQQKITKIYNELLRFIELRKSIRINEKTLQKRERQIQLNVGCRLTFEQLSNKLLLGYEEQLIKKQQIEELLIGL